MNSTHVSPRRHGFTLVEAILAGLLIVVLIGWLIVILIQFQRGFSQGEEAAVAQNEAGCFLSYLRYDLVNAVGPTGPGPHDGARYLNVTPEKLSFNIYKDINGTTEPVEYLFERFPNGGAIQRVQGSYRRLLVDHHIASLTWQIGSDLVTHPEIASGYRRIWVSVKLLVRGHTKFGNVMRDVSIETNIFPTRLNRQLNGDGSIMELAAPPEE